MLIFALNSRLDLHPSHSFEWDGNFERILCLSEAGAVCFSAGSNPKNVGFRIDFL